MTELKSYKDAWIKLQQEVLDERTSWGKEQLKKRMDRLLIECMAACLAEGGRDAEDIP